MRALVSLQAERSNPLRPRPLSGLLRRFAPRNDGGVKSLALAVYPAAAAGLAWRRGRGNDLRLVLVFAAAWIVTEWLRATLFTGFAWNPAGVVLLPTGAARMATLVGTYGLSGVTMLVAGILLLLAKREVRSALMLFAGLAV